MNDCMCGMCSYCCSGCPVEGKWRTCKMNDVLKQEQETKIYQNADKKCECWKCELKGSCHVRDKNQRLPRTVRGALGLCEKLK